MPTCRTTWIGYTTVPTSRGGCARWRRSIWRTSWDSLHIGEKAAEWYQAEIVRLQQMLGAAHGKDHAPTAPPGGLVEGQLEGADDATWIKFAQTFLQT